MSGRRAMSKNSMIEGLNGPPPPYSLSMSSTHTLDVKEKVNAEPPGTNTAAPCYVLTPDDIVIAVMGITGSGKTSFISLLAKDPSQLVVGNELESCTSKVEIYECRSNTNQRVFLIDTPGFDDTYKSDTDILREIANWLQQAYENQILLSGIIYLHRIQDVRMAGTAMKNLRMFNKLCGEDNLHCVVLATTMWAGIDEKTGGRREEQLRSNFWKKMVSHGSQIIRHDQGVQSAEAILDYLVSSKKQVILEIQDELVNNGKKLNDTAAGSEIQAELDRVLKTFKEELAEVQVEMQKAAASSDKKHRQELNELRKDLLDVLKKNEEDHKKLLADKDDLRQQMKAEAEQRARDLQAKDQEIQDLRRQIMQQQNQPRRSSHPASNPNLMMAAMNQNFLSQQERIRELSRQTEERQKEINALRAEVHTRGRCVVM